MERDGEEWTYKLRSLLDTDLYKFTMQQAIKQQFPETRALYKFTHRDSDVFFPRKCVDLFHKSIQRFRDLQLTTEERVWMKNKCSYFTEEYLDYLSDFRFNPDQVSITFIPHSDDGEQGRVEIEASGLWVETILWEVPMMACLSEIYFHTGATDWSYEGQKESASTKAQALLQAGCIFSEFGTRRRRSFHTQDLVIQTLIEEAGRSPGQGVFFGTSNVEQCILSALLHANLRFRKVYFAKKYDIRPVGTIAHEWFMGVAGLKGYEGANTKALDLWEETYRDNLLAALTDTFSTKVFFQDLSKDPERARRWTTLRQDSGDPFEFAPAAKAMYESIGIDFRTKSIIYSDALTLDKTLQLKKQCDEIGFRCSFGIGTFLTNDFKTKSSGYREKSRALNMVIKLAKVDDQECVKISDDLTKNTGAEASVEFVKKLYQLSY